MSLFGGLFGASTDVGSRIVARARQDVGRTEEGFNRGAIVREALRNTGHTEGAPWCAGWATNVANDACRPLLGERNLVQTTAGSLASMEDARRAGVFSADFNRAKPGDFMYFTREQGGHQAVYVGRDADGRHRLIEGNVGLENRGHADGRQDGVREGAFTTEELQARGFLGFGHNSERAAHMMAMGGPTQAMHVQTASIGGFSVPNSLPTLPFDPARTVG